MTVGHAPVSVVITASGTADDLRACLESLRAELGVRDEVVCLVPPGRADLRRELAGRAWLRVLDQELADHGQRWAAGVAATRYPVVVLLDGDVIGSPHWLDAVTAPFADPDVVAAGPRCHRSYGPQNADLPAQARTSAASFKAYARQWWREHGPGLVEVDRLGPVCVAVRRDALDEAGGPGAEPPYERLRAQGRIVLVERALLAHVGTDRCALRARPVPADVLVSASLIVKDEEDVLAGCLIALREFVDEIVVYDTGSTDRTVEIAREHGARVVEGYWNDNFGEARNRSMAHCRGEWVFVVDADEVVRGDPAAFRTGLTAAGEAARLVYVQSLEGHGHEGRGVLSIRLFRRCGRYYGRLHEQVVDAVTGELLTGPALPDVELLHLGYTATRYLVKNKGERNVRLAALAVRDHAASHESLANLARSEMLAGRGAEAIEACRKGLADRDGGRYRQTFLQVMIHAYVALGRAAEADEALARLRAERTEPMTEDLAARVAFAKGDYAGALAIIEEFPEQVTDARLMVMSRRQLADVEVVSRYRLGRFADAARVLCGYLERGDVPLPVPYLAEVLRADGQGIATVARLIPRTSLRGLVIAALEAPAALADELLDALWERFPGDGLVLAVAARIGAGLALVRALEWSVRLRGYGFGGDCTLLSLAASSGRSARDRSLAAGIALEMFGDERAMPLLAQALAEVPADEASALLAEMRALAPGVAAAVEPADATG